MGKIGKIWGNLGIWELYTKFQKIMTTSSELPFAPSDSVWPTLAAAFLTSVVGQRDPCVIVPNSREYARERDDLGGAQRLAVMAVDFSRWSRRSLEDVGASLRRAAAIASRVRRSRSTARTTRRTSAAMQKRFCASADQATSGRALAWVGRHPDRMLRTRPCTRDGRGRRSHIAQLGRSAQSIAC